jgi:hypothetical protein
VWVRIALDGVVWVYGGAVEASEQSTGLAAPGQPDTATLQWDALADELVNHSIAARAVGLYTAADRLDTAAGAIRSDLAMQQAQRDLR